MDGTLRLYTKTMESIHIKITSFFDENITRITKFVKSDRLEKLYQSQVINAEVTDSMFFSITLNDIEYFLTNVMQDTTKIAYESTDFFATWYQQLNEIILSSSKHDKNDNSYYYVPSGDNKNLKELEQKIDQDMKEIEEKINNHFDIGKEKDFLNTTGNRFTIIEKKLSDKVNYTYESKIEISVRKPILDSSSIKDIKLPNFIIFANGTVAKEKLDQISKNIEKINNIQNDKKNYIYKEKEQYKIEESVVSDKTGKSEYTNIIFKNYSNNSYENFDLNELIINYDGFTYYRKPGVNYDEKIPMPSFSLTIFALGSNNIDKLRETVEDDQVVEIAVKITVFFESGIPGVKYDFYKWNCDNSSAKIFNVTYKFSNWSLPPVVGQVVTSWNYKYEYSYNSTRLNEFELETEKLKNENVSLQKEIDKIASTFFK